MLVGRRRRKPYDPARATSGHSPQLSGQCETYLLAAPGVAPTQTRQRHLSVRAGQAFSAMPASASNYPYKQKVDATL